MLLELTLWLRSVSRCFLLYSDMYIYCVFTPFSCYLISFCSWLRLYSVYSVYSVYFVFVFYFLFYYDSIWFIGMCFLFFLCVDSSVSWHFSSRFFSWKAFVTLTPRGRCLSSRSSFLMHPTWNGHTTCCSRYMPLKSHEGWGKGNYPGTCLLLCFKHTVFVTQGTLCYGSVHCPHDTKP